MSSIDDNFGSLIRNASNLNPILSEWGLMAVAEIKKTIEVGGRPERWPDSGRVKAFGGQTLRQTGAFMNSITFEVDDQKSVTIGPGIAVAFKARFLVLGGVIKAKNGGYLTFRVPSRLVTHSKSGKPLSKPRGEYTFVRVRQVIGKPHDIFYLPPDFFDRAKQAAIDYLTGNSHAS